jgi:hypothetical protein
MIDVPERRTPSNANCVGPAGSQIGITQRNGETRHAAFLMLTIDPDQAPAAANAFARDILPKIRSAPGFVAGYWLEPVDGQGFAFVVFETEEQARRSAPPAGNWPAPGVSINEVDFRRVAASA